MGYQLRQIAKRVNPPTMEERKKKLEQRMAQSAGRRGFNIDVGRYLKRVFDEKADDVREQSSRLAARDALEAKAAAKRARRRATKSFGDGRPPGHVNASHPDEIARLKRLGFKVRECAYTPPKVRHAQAR